MLFLGDREGQLAGVGLRRAEVQIALLDVFHVRGHGRLQRRHRRVADRSGGQRGHVVGVVGILLGDIRVGQGQLVLAAEVGDGGIALQLHAQPQAVVEHRGDPGVILAGGGFLFDHRGQRDRLVHGQLAVVGFDLVIGALLVGVILGAVGVEYAVHHLVVLVQQRSDDAFGGGRDEHPVGVRGEVALQRVLAARQRPRVLGVPQRVGAAHEAVHVVAEAQELAGILQSADTHKVIRDVLRRPAGHDGDDALVGLAAGGQFGDDLPGIHARRQLEGAVAQGVGQPPKLHHVLENPAVPQQIGRHQAFPDLGDGLATVDREVDHLGVARLDRGEEGVVHAVIAHRHHAGDHQRAAYENQHGPDDLPEPGIPVHAVLPILVQGAYAVFFRLEERLAPLRTALLSLVCHCCLQSPPAPPFRRGRRSPVTWTACPGRCRPRRQGS